MQEGQDCGLEKDQEESSSEKPKGEVGRGSGSEGAAVVRRRGRGRLERYNGRIGDAREGVEP